MKKLLFLLLVVSLTLTSCEYKCDDLPGKFGFKSSSGSDSFYAEKLLGTWQSSELEVGVYDIKQMKFISGNKVDVIISRKYDTDRFTYTYSYTYYGDYIKFYSEYAGEDINSFQFKIVNYLYPELTLQDSFGMYVMRKVKANGC